MKTQPKARLHKGVMGIQTYLSIDGGESYELDFVINACEKHDELVQALRYALELSFDEYALTKQREVLKYAIEKAKGDIK